MSVEGACSKLACANYNKGFSGQSTRQKALEYRFAKKVLNRKLRNNLTWKALVVLLSPFKMCSTMSIWDRLFSKIKRLKSYICMISVFCFLVYQL